MKQIRMLAQYYVDLMMKLGLVRFSMLLALALVVLASWYRWRLPWCCMARLKVSTLSALSSLAC